MKFSQDVLVSIARRVAEAASRRVRGKLTPEELLGAAYELTARRAARWEQRGMPLRQYVMLAVGRLVREAVALEDVTMPSVHEANLIRRGEAGRRRFVRLDHPLGSEDGADTLAHDTVSCAAAGHADTAAILEARWRHAEVKQELDTILKTAPPRVRMVAETLLGGGTIKSVADSLGLTSQAVNLMWAKWCARATQRRIARMSHHED